MERPWTSGPWIAREQMSKDHRSLGWIIEHPNGRIGWASFATKNPNEGEGPPYSQSGYDARLIAAAPDLADQHDSNIVDLEFLRGAIAEGDPAAELMFRVNDLIRHSRAALSRALGKE